jgi:pyruvate carboxylase subunit B
MKKIKFMDCSFRDGFQCCLGGRVKTEDFLPALEAAVNAGINSFEIGGGVRFPALYFYCREDAFQMMDKCREVVGADVNLQTFSRGVNVVGLFSQSSDIIDLHAKLFKKHGITTIRNYDALNDVRNLDVSGRSIVHHGLRHQITITMMGLAPGINETYAHTPKFYADRLKEILDRGVPFDSLAFVDEIGTSTPATVYETIRQARAMLGNDKEIQFHCHDTAGMACACNFAAICGGADIIDLAMSPLSGGTCQTDVLSMHECLQNTDFTLDIDPKKFLHAEKIFEACMSKYLIPKEALQLHPEVLFAMIPGGALTSNTQMMRDNNVLHMLTRCLREMSAVVSRSGFGTSVTPVSQFFFQQAFRNAVMGKNPDGSWKLDPNGYGKLVLGYFGKPPIAPDPQVVKWASEQLRMDPATKSVVEINDANPKLGVKAATAVLEQNSLPVTDENIFIVAACGDKGLAYLKGDRPLGIRCRDSAKPAENRNIDGPFTVNVDGKTVIVEFGVSDGCYIAEVEGKKFNVTL